ncbi:D-alanyl-D-alanine carboxypeptidase [Streptomyces triticagri]|uniref:D-alanyl-D-alanine carboxypeptidase n=1 Tax=Streptomyces triticagri TaxID=2293568 RepID=UPI002D7A32F2|nr:D-alanyl-D-alanine carboxypeptidase [Streptomyces triticagri]
MSADDEAATSTDGEPSGDGAGSEEGDASEGGAQSARTDESAGSSARTEESAGSDVAPTDAGSAAGADSESATDEDVTSGEGAAPEAEAEPEATVPAGEAAAPDAGGEGGDDADEDAGPEADANAQAEAGTGGEGPDDSDDTGEADSPDTAPDATTPTDGEPATASEPEATDAADAAATPDEGHAPDPSDEQDPSDEHDPSDRPDTTDETDTTDTPDADANDSAPATPVDHATAVFKAVQPPPVDQPTAVFKAVRPDAEAEAEEAEAEADGGHKAPEDGKAAAPEAAPEPGKGESPAERTSKFVALKPLDEPPAEPAKPAQPEQPAAEAPAPPKPGEPPASVGNQGPERTTQQPVPPLPPLDLLAELTNKPAPPETPMRTIVRRFKIWTPLVALLVIAFGVVQTLRPLPEPKLNLTANDTVSFEGDKPSMPWPENGQGAMDVDGLGTFGSSGEQKPVPIASVAKVMTAYIILRDHPGGATIPMDQQAEDDAKKSEEGESTVDVTKGQRLTKDEAIKAIMIASANNIARQLARWDAGSEKAFVEKMNETADELGMKNTTYTDPSGLNKSTVSTAVDQVKLGKKAMEDKLFREIVRLPEYKDINDKRQPNWNQLVPMNGVVGIKTGTTTAALGNLLFAAEKKVGGSTQTVVGAVLRQPAAGDPPSILKGALDAGDVLMRAAQDALEAKSVVKKGDVVGEVDDGLGGTTPVVATKDVSAVGWPGLTVKLDLADDGKAIPHTAKAGTKVGVLTVGDGTGDAVEVPVALQADLTEPGFGAKVTRIT